MAAVKASPQAPRPPTDAACAEDALCIVCMERPRSVRLLPCDHLHLCMRCYKGVKERNNLVGAAGAGGWHRGLAGGQEVGKVEYLEAGESLKGWLTLLCGMLFCRCFAITECSSWRHRGSCFSAPALICAGLRILVLMLTLPLSAALPPPLQCPWCRQEIKDALKAGAAKAAV